MLPLSFEKFSEYYRSIFKKSMLFTVTDQEIKDKFSYITQAYFEDLNQQEKYFATKLAKKNIHEYINFLGVHKTQFGFIEETEKIRKANRFLEVLNMPNYLFDNMINPYKYRFGVFYLDNLLSLKLINRVISKTSFLIIIFLALGFFPVSLPLLVIYISAFLFFFFSFYCEEKIAKLEKNINQNGISKYLIINQLYPEMLDQLLVKSFLIHKLNFYLKNNEPANQSLQEKLNNKIIKENDILSQITSLNIYDFSPLGVDGKKFISEYSNTKETLIMEYHLISCGLFFPHSDKQKLYQDIINSLKSYEHFICKEEINLINQSLKSPIKISAIKKI